MSFGSLRDRFRLKNLNWFALFLIVESVAFIAFHIYNLAMHGQPLDSLLHSPKYRFNDYFMHIGYASTPFGTNIYKLAYNVCFPPLAYLMYFFLARIVGNSGIDPNQSVEHREAGNNMTIYVLYTVVCIVILVYAVSLYMKKKGFVYQVVFPLILILTYPVALAAIQRGTSVLLTVGLLSIALAWRNDPSKVKREMAMVLIAVCAGLKIYPAIFGLLYLKEKRWKETIRLVIYGVVLFFVPFLFFGGIEGFKSFLETLRFLTRDVHPNSVSGIVRMFTEAVFGKSIFGFTFLMQQLFLVLCIAAFFATKDKWGEFLTLCSLMAVYIQTSWMYTCIYILPVVLCFMAEKDFKPISLKNGRWVDIIGFVLFLTVFSFPYPLDYVPIYICIVVLTVIYDIAVLLKFIYHKVYEKLTASAA